MRLPATATDGWNSWPRRLDSDVGSTTAGFDHFAVPPLNDRFDMTMREYPVGGLPHAPCRCAHTAWKAVPSNTTNGCVVVRKLADVLFCVNAQMLATTLGLLNDRPSSLEIAAMMASVCLKVVSANRRQTTTTRRAIGSTAMSGAWLTLWASLSVVDGSQLSP